MGVIGGPGLDVGWRVVFGVADGLVVGGGGGDLKAEGLTAGLGDGEVAGMELI